MKTFRDFLAESQVNEATESEVLKALGGKNFDLGKLISKKYEKVRFSDNERRGVIEAQFKYESEGAKLENPSYKGVITILVTIDGDEHAVDGKKPLEVSVERTATIIPEKEIVKILREVKETLIKTVLKNSKLKLDDENDGKLPNGRNTLIWFK